MSGANHAEENQYFSRIAAAAMGLTLGFGGTTLLLPAADAPAKGINRLVPETFAAERNTPAPATSVDYANCSAARVAGAAPIKRGQAGYGRHLDADGDGRACE